MVGASLTHCCSFDTNRDAPRALIVPVMKLCSTFRAKHAFPAMHNITRRFHLLKVFIFLVLLSFAWMGGSAEPLAAVGDVNYISDVVNVPLRSGPSTAHRILHRGLPSGTKLTVVAINEEAGYTQVRTEGGLEGWVTSHYLTAEPIARVQLASAEKRLQSLKAELDKERETRAKIQAEYKETEAANQKLTAQVEALAKELADLKLISAEPIKEHARNVELTRQNEKLAEEVRELSSTIMRLEDNVQLQWLLYGGGLVLLGLILGVALKARPRKTSYPRYS